MIAKLVILFIILQIFLSTDTKIVNQLNQPLGPEYTTDMRAFLKTTQLMKSGKDFYPAFFEGMAGLRAGSFHPDINAWRQPFIFHLWKIAPVYPLWQLFLIFIIIASYLITKNVLSPIILWPFLHYSLVDLTILQPEWWGMAFLVFGLCFHRYKKHFIAGLFFLMALLCRELFIIPVFFITLFNFKKYIYIYVLFFSYYFFYHLPNIFSFNTEFLRSTTSGSWKTLHSVFAYGSWEYIFGVYRPILLLFLVTTAISIIRRKNTLLFLSFFPFFVFTAIMAITGKIDATRDYWSIYFVPLLLISAPGIIFPSEKK